MTRRKDGCGRRRETEKKVMRRVKKKLDNEKVAGGRIVNPRGLALSIAFFLDNENSNSMGLNFPPSG